MKTALIGLIVLVLAAPAVLAAPGDGPKDVRDHLASRVQHLWDTGVLVAGDVNVLAVRMVPEM